MLKEKIDPPEGCEEIHLAAKAGNIKRLKEILAANPKDIEAVDSNEQTPLFYAVRFQKMNAVKYLLACGADVDCVDDKQRNLLVHAKIEGKETPLSKYLAKRILLEPKIIEKLATSFERLLKTQLQLAKKLGKHFVLMLGECHGSAKITQVEKAFVTIAYNQGIREFNFEYPNRRMGYLDCEIVSHAKALNMVVRGVDNHPLRDVANLQERNTHIKKEIEQNNKNCILIVGSSHMFGFNEQQSTKLNTNTFHILPLNLSRFASSIQEQRIENDLGATRQEGKFSLNSKKVIQVSAKGISSAALPLKKWNNFLPHRLLKSVLDWSLIVLIGLFVSLLLTGPFGFAIIVCAPIGNVVNSIYHSKKHQLQTYGLHEYRDLTEKELQSFTPERLQAFMDGTHSKVATSSEKLKSFFSFRNWQWSKDYYAGEIARETEDDELIATMRKRFDFTCPSKL